MLTSDKDALEQWRILYGNPEQRDSESSDRPEPISEGAKRDSEEPAS
jgi:hypothetical protein